ncbi:uncharacterized protein DS421_3g86620 [Arachis hypogaea]|nr:uncharacterized protein DS421_3g86620 [Arachis hypogaea]
MVRACGALVCAGCCPALTEGRAELFGAPDLMPVRAAGAAEPSLGAPEWCTCVHHQNAALPSRRAGQCFQIEAPCSILV